MNVEKNNALLAIIRLRGTRGVRSTVTKTLALLGLTRKNHCVLVKQNASVKGMLTKAQDYATWGEVSPETVSGLFEKRGEVNGGKKLSKEFVSSNSKFRDLKEFEKAVFDGTADASAVPGVKKVFRLSPPRKGLESIKSLYPNGACGYRGKEINALLQRMM